MKLFIISTLILDENTDDENSLLIYIAIGAAVFVVCCCCVIIVVVVLKRRSRTDHPHDTHDPYTVPPDDMISARSQVYGRAPTLFDNEFQQNSNSNSSAQFSPNQYNSARLVNDTYDHMPQQQQQQQPRNVYESCNAPLDDASTQQYQQFGTARQNYPNKHQPYGRASRLAELNNDAGL